MLVAAVPMEATAVVQRFENDIIDTRDGKTLKITFIKHGSLLLDFDGLVVYVDPVSEYADYSQLPKADYILLTHEHGDHLDAKAIANIEKEGTSIVANAASAQKLGRGIIMENGDHFMPEARLELEAVPAYNTTEGRDKYHPRHRDNGYILTLGGTRVYIAGDTEDIPELSQLEDIDIAFLPVNQPYTMTVLQAARAARMFKPRILYPYHYGDTQIEALKEALKDESEIEVRIRALQ